MNDILDLPGVKEVRDTETTYGPGIYVEFEDGTKISARPGARSVDKPTIDVTRPGKHKEKNRFNRNDDLEDTSNAKNDVEKNANTNSGDKSTGQNEGEGGEGPSTIFDG